MRLIDAEELIMRFCENPQFSTTTFKKVRSVVDGMPTIEAEPVKHGRGLLLIVTAHVMNGIVLLVGAEDEA